MEQSNESKIRAALVATIVAEALLTDREIAIAIANSQAELVAAWTIDRLAAMVRPLRPKPPAAEQTAFPLHDLTAAIPLKLGKSAIGQATIGILRQSEKLLRKKYRSAKPRSNSLLGRIQRQIELMEPWSYANRRITVDRVQELIASGTPPPIVPKVSRMSDRMKRYWEEKSPEERAAIARRRIAKRRKKVGAK